MEKQDKSKDIFEDMRSNVYTKLEKLFDNGDYKELFKFAQTSKKRKGKSVITATGFIHNRPVMVYATDFSYQGGSIGKFESDLIAETYRLAKQSGIPIISLINSGGARITDGIYIMEGFGQIFREASYCSGVIPQITCVENNCIGASAFTALLTDFIFMTKDSVMSLAGAEVNKIATGENYTNKEIGGVEIHTQHTGAVHFIEENIEDILFKVRDLIKYLPQNNSEKPNLFEFKDNNQNYDYKDIIPKDDKTPFDIKKLITQFTDDNEFFEIQKEFAPNLIIGFATFEGMTVGVCANQSLYGAGALDSKAFRKVSRFINFLSAFNIPMLSFVDVPGALPTLEENKNGILIYGSQFMQSLAHHKHLKVTIVVRRCFGGAYGMMSPKSGNGDIIYSYPDAMIGVMSHEAMTSVLKSTGKEVDFGGIRSDSPLIAASLGYIDDIIEPKNTRKELINALKVFGTKRDLNIPPKWLNNPFL